MRSASLLLLATVCFVAMVSPGPDFLLVTRNSLTMHRSRALATAFGIAAGCLVHATYCVLGLAFVIARSIILFSTIKYAGAIYLMYLGIKALTSKSTPVPRNALAVSKKAVHQLTTRGAFMQGFLCNVLNPKCAVFILSLFTQFMPENSLWQDKIAVAAVFVGESALYWPLLVMILQSNGIRSRFTRIQSTLDRVCGGLLLYVGIRIAISREH